MFQVIHLEITSTKLKKIRAFLLNNNAVMSNLHKHVISIEQAQIVIDVMNRSFDSHQFIIEFILRYPQTYIELLGRYGATRKAHGAIAACLQENSHILSITRRGKVRSQNIYGRDTLCELWEKR